MAIVVTVAKIQQWLEKTKLTITSVDPDQAESARQIAFAQLVNSYDTTVWVDVATTPKLVQSAISMLIAAWIYQKAYSEDGIVPAYGISPEEKAYALLNGIADGVVALEEYPGVGAQSETVSFLPDDSTGRTDTYDAQGFLIGLSGDEDVKFSMAVKF